MKRRDLPLILTDIEKPSKQPTKFNFLTELIFLIRDKSHVHKKKKKTNQYLKKKN